MLTIRILTEADYPFAMALKAEANWNQTEEDWRRFQAMQPDGLFLAELDGEPAGTLYACQLADVAWIAMVLVPGCLRGKGIGTALMRHGLDYLDSHGVHTVRLDATPLGQPIYEKQGFIADYLLHRYQGVAPATTVPDGITPYMPEHLEAIIALDRVATGTDRRTLLVGLLERYADVTRLVFDGDRLLGFSTARPGVHATEIGPLQAVNADAAHRLFADACARYAGQPIYVDVPTINAPAIAMVETAGLTVQRPLLRMTRGPKIMEDTPCLWASSGPEMG